MAERILRTAGELYWFEDETALNAVTALSGSGPAYFFLFIEALETGGIGLGLPPQAARALAIQTAYGAARLALESDESPAALRAQVTSPGGTTEMAIGVFEKGGLRKLVAEAMGAAAQRAHELARS
jgi:pyrroline-5-carboxylate reductase